MVCEKGDWVRFYNNGVLVIGVVEYRTKDKTLGHIELCTNVGSVHEEDILERRRPQ